MALAIALLEGVGLILIMVGMWQALVERSRSPARAAAEAAGAAAGKSPTRAVAHTPLPWPLHYVERRAKTAGVELGLVHVFALILGCGLAAAATLYMVAGVPWMTVAAAFAGFWAPLWHLGRLADRRSQQVLRQLDQVCTELIQAMAGGQDLYAALQQQAQRAPDPVGRELHRVMERVRQGEPLGDAMAELPERIALEETRLLSVGVRLALDAGARIVPVLESIQRSLRGRREMHGLIRELSVRNEKQSLILMVVPMVMLLIMRLEAPEYVAPLLATATGQMVLAVDILWMLFGARLVRGFFSTTPLT
ncbi:MAG TPA: type II secretion system F family protein [Bacillota bacterium]|nr:type II secretion system F family protein [Bacillota bacterium]